MSQMPIDTGPTTKFALVAVLFLFALIPGWLISGLVGEREGRQTEMAREFAASWGPEQTLTTPLLIIPYQVVTDGPRQYLKIGAEKLEVVSHLAGEDRRRGLFHATVYGATVQMRGAVRIPSQGRLTALLPEGARLLWQESFVALGVSSRSGMKDGDRLVWNGQTVPFQNCREIVSAEEECRTANQLMARVADVGAMMPDAEMSFEAAIDLRGTGSFTLASSARQFDVSASSSWPTPSFGGSLLPVSSRVGRNGFEARWQAVDYGAPQSWPASHVDAGPTGAVHSVKIELLDAVPIYRMIHRASKYHALFLALCFATYLLFEVLSGLRIHLVQYGLMALSLSLFALLLLSLAELLGYAVSFLVSSLLILIQASLYTWSVTRRVRETSLFACMLAALFGFLHVLLSLESYALLVGSLALFFVLSALMALTSKIDWTRWGTTAPR